MMLGDLIGRLADDTDASASLDALDDIVLFAAVQAMADRRREAVGEYVAGAARRFASRAGDEDWLGLMGAIERSVDPARAVLERMLRWALSRDAEGECAGAADRCGCSAAG